MDLRQSLELIREHEKDLVLFNLPPGDTIVDDLRAYFRTQNVHVTAERTASGRPTDLAVLSSRDSVLAVFRVSTLRELLDRTPTGPDETGIADAEYETVLGHLKETTFTSYDTEEMLYASREIEDRARRVRGGTVHAGFQHLSIMADQEPIYTDLAERGVEVHAYGVPDTAPPEFWAGRVHAVDTDEIARMWFVVFDGGGDESQKSALLAEERDNGEFYGAWTYDAPIVDSVCTYLERTYVSPGETATEFERR